MAEGNSDLQHIRHATLEDYEAVMAINETIFHGADYLPVMYSQIVTDPMTRSYVLEIGNDVAGFCAFTVVNDGKTVLLKGARIKEKYQGFGYFWKNFTPVCQSDIRYHFPQVENCIQMSMFKLGNIKDFEKSVTSNPLVHLVCRVTVQATAKDIDPVKLECPGDDTIIHFVKQSELQRTMEENIKLLEPFIELAYQPYLVNSANIRYIVDNVNPAAFVSKKQATEQTEHFASGMSFQTSFISKIGLVAYCCFRVSNVKDFGLHFKAQLQYILQNKLTTEHEIFQIYVMFPVHMRFGEVLDVAYSCGMKPGIKDEGILYVSSSTKSYESKKL